MPLLVAAVVLAGSSAPTVEPLGVAVARLGAALGRPVETARALAGIPVLVDAPGLGAEATLRAFAAATRSTLVRDGKVLRLERTNANRAALVAAHRAILRTRVVAGLAAWDEATKHSQVDGDIANQVKAARARRDAAVRAQQAANEAGGSFTPPDLVFPELLTPAARLLRAILDRLGPDRLAALGPDEVQFLSDHPNAAESSLPNIADLIDAYLKTEARYAPAMDLVAPEGKPAKIVLTLKEWGASLGLYDAAGKRTDGGGAHYGNPGVFYMPPPEPPGSAAPDLVPLDEASLRLRALFRPPDGLVMRLRAADLPKAILRPERFDPLDFEIRTGLLALARAPGTKGRVAALSDDLLGTANASVKDGRLDATAFAWRLTHSVAYARKVQDGVELIQPEDALASEAAIVDRKALGQGIRQIVADGGARLGNWATLHLALFTGHRQPVTDRILGAVQRFGHANLRTFDHQNGEWAILGAALQANVPVAEGGVPPFGRLLGDGVTQGWLHFAGPPGTSDLELAPSSLLASIRGARIVSRETKTLVAKPYGGFDANGPIQLAFEKADLEQIQEGFSDALEPESLGADLALPGRRFFPDMTTRPVSDGDRRDAERRVQGLRYLLGNRVELGLDVLIGRGLHTRIEARDWTIDRQGTAFAELPPTFREAVLRGVAQALDNPTDISKPRTGDR